MALAVPTARPHFFLFADSPLSSPPTSPPTMLLEPEPPQAEKRGQKLYYHMWNRLSLHRLGNWLKKEDHGQPPPPEEEQQDRDQSQDQDPHGPMRLEKSRFLSRRGSRKVVPGLPRPLTFRRMNSEKRERLYPVEPDKHERRAHSMDRRPAAGAKRTLSPPRITVPSHSAPDVSTPQGAKTTSSSFADEGDRANGLSDYSDGQDAGGNSIPDYAQREPLPPLSTPDDLSDRESMSEEGIDDHLLQQELEAKWILNLSMHFRDLSDREKFFITYAEEPNKWRRVTVSCDYRDVPPDSLEADLKSLHYQRDKSTRIYESIRDSLPDIQFYPTVTNLKLQTADGRLHVHVTEDVTEIIPYPSVSAVRHLPGPRFHESAVCFDSHISGFVYRVAVDDRVYIKKEIPGPDTVDEFLYEINALCTLQNSQSVIKYEGLVVDDQEELVKGVLISYADLGALVDILFDWKGTTSLPWSRRELWAKQIIQGLSEIHEAGFVQGDFTLSNIVIDADDNAKIIDINRRGCPVGWEPPELSKLIENGHRISIYIGVKSDLFQLGMVLWALAAEQDEPERQERPLSWNDVDPEVPLYFKKMVESCLSEDPRRRLSAKELLARFPAHVRPNNQKSAVASRHSVSTHRSDKEYIDPATAVELADIEYSRQHTDNPSRPSSISAEDLGFADAGASTSYKVSSSGSFIVPRRGRPRACVSGQSSTSISINANQSRRSYNYSHSPTAGFSSVSLEDSDIEAAFDDETDLAPREPRWEKVYVDGDAKLVQMSGSGIENHGFIKKEEDIGCLPSPPSGEKVREEDTRGPLQTNCTPKREREVSLSTDTLTPSATTTAKPKTPEPEPEPESKDPEPIPPRQSEPPRTPPFRASFHDRVQLRRSCDSTLADLGDEFLHRSPGSITRGTAEPVDRRDESPDPKIELLRHYDSGFHEQHAASLVSGARTGSFGPPLHTDSGFDYNDIRRRISRTRTSTFGPPIHSDSGFQEDALPTGKSPHDNDELSTSIEERAKQDEAKVREVVRKIISGEFANDGANSKPQPESRIT